MRARDGGSVTDGHESFGMLSLRPPDRVGGGSEGAVRSRVMATVVAGLLLVGSGAANAAGATGPAATPPAAIPAPVSAPVPVVPPVPAPDPTPGVLGSALSALPLPTRSTGCLSGNPWQMTGRLPSGRRYLMHLPRNHDASRPYPVVLAYHGRSQQARDIQRYSGLDAADAVVLYPQGRSIEGRRGTTAWEGTRDLPVDGKDVAFTRDLLATAGRSLCLDMRQVTAVGASQGGGFAHVLACTAPGTVSAIAAVAGAFYRPEAGGVRQCRSGPLRVLEFHGTSDPIIDDKGTRRSRPIRDWLGDWATRNRCTGGPAVTPVPPDVTEMRWARCAGGSEVAHFRITRGNHGWPGGAAASVAGGGVRTETISATRIILRFAAGLPLDPATALPPSPGRRAPGPQAPGPREPGTRAAVR